MKYSWRFENEDIRVSCPEDGLTATFKRVGSLELPCPVENDSRILKFYLLDSDSKWRPSFSELAVSTPHIGKEMAIQLNLLRCECFGYDITEYVFTLFNTYLVVSTKITDRR